MKNFMKGYGYLFVIFAMIGACAFVGTSFDKRYAPAAIVQRQAVIVPKSNNNCNGITLDNGAEGSTCDRSEVSLTIGGKDFLVCDCR